VRLIAKVLGALLAFAGVFFALQGAGVIMWPADSFMLAASVWISYGLLIAAVGALLVWWGSRPPRA
jgi:hypothetical protein